jgi:hypothetical protein
MHIFYRLRLTRLSLERKELGFVEIFSYGSRDIGLPMFIFLTVCGYGVMTYVENFRFSDFEKS